jgi:hypothetical protein
MYLLDPASGQRRRRVLAGHARGAVGSGREWIGHAGRSVSDRVGTVTHEVIDRARGSMPTVSFEPRRTAIPAIPGIAGGAVLLALGAALVYLLDPDRGESRRTSIRNRVHDSITDTGEFFRRAGGRIREHLGHSGNDARVESESDLPAAHHPV